MTTGQFDERDLRSFYYRDLNHEDADAILMDEEEGVFLVRNSKLGGYVICLKENNRVMHYSVSTSETGKLYVRPEFLFNDLAALLSFYKRNTFTSIALIRPVSNDQVVLHTAGAGERRTIQPDHLHQPNDRSTSAPPLRQSAPPLRNSCPPVYAKVVKGRTPIPYEHQALPIKVGDIIRVTTRKNGLGYGELVDTGRRGNFPLTHVELIEFTEAQDS